MKTDGAISRNVERLFHAIGINQRRRADDYLLPAIGVFAVGVLVGGVVGLLFAPQSGRKLRSDLNKRFDQVRERVFDHHVST